MLFASTHFTNVAGPGNTPPVVSAAPLTSGGERSGTHRQRGQARRAVGRLAARHRERHARRSARSVPAVLRRRRRTGGARSASRNARRARASSIAADGLILTNNHVVPKGVSKITVVFANGDHVPGHVYSSNPASIWRWSRSTTTPSCRRRSNSATARSSTPVSGRSRRRTVRTQAVGVGRRRLRLQPRRADPGRERQLAALPRDAPDLGADQPRQLGRPAGRRSRPADRREPVDGQPAGGRPGHRLRDPVQRRAPDRRRTREEPGQDASTPSGTGTGVGYIGVGFSRSTTTSAPRSTTRPPPATARWSPRSRPMARPAKSISRPAT